jgi:hypothetical protein
LNKFLEEKKQKLMSNLYKTYIPILPLEILLLYWTANAKTFYTPREGDL